MSKAFEFSTGNAAAAWLRRGEALLPTGSQLAVDVVIARYELARDVLARIAAAHREDPVEFACCGECLLPWPCQTYRWASAQYVPTEPWDPDDDLKVNTS